MKLITPILLSLIIISSCTRPIEKVQFKELNIIPMPQEVSFGNSYFSLNETIVIAYSDESIEHNAEYFQTLLNAQGIKLICLPLAEVEDQKSIVLNIVEDENLQKEGAYTLVVEKNRVSISANSGHGIFYGIQSFFQITQTLSDTTEINIPALNIFDQPNFSYRGMHLDVARHMFPVEFIKEYIDLLALYKFNTFHWHLTEDQGWRIEIKKYPKLTEIGSFRKETLIGHGGKTPFTFDGKPYGGFYTQDEISEVVAYAAERYITIIPEIEMPGHSLAALSAYPELACTEGPFEASTRWGVFQDIYCSKEETFVFLENVLLEVMELFPSHYIHIGGDEAPKDRWKECPSCQSVIEREGLEDEHQLQSYFIQRIEKFVNSHGHSIIGWDEILEGGLAPNATVMSWRGIDGGIAAATQGHDAIMTPGSHCYFDHYQSKLKTEPLAIGGFTDLEKVYSYNPVPDSLNEEQAKHILGTQANVWTEYMQTPDHVEYMILPRMAALAEVNWTNPELKDWSNFEKRITKHYAIYETLGYNYCDHSYGGPLE